jgi:hypothetical protein
MERVGMTPNRCIVLAVIAFAAVAALLLVKPKSRDLLVVRHCGQYACLCWYGAEVWVADEELKCKLEDLK